MTSVSSLHPAVKFFLLPALAGTAAVGIAAMFGGAGMGTALMLKMGRVIPFAGKLALTVLPILGAGGVVLVWKLQPTEEAEQKKLTSEPSEHEGAEPEDTFAPLRAAGEQHFATGNDGKPGYVRVRSETSEACVVTLFRPVAEGIAQREERSVGGMVITYVQAPQKGWEFVHYACKNEEADQFAVGAIKMMRLRGLTEKAT